MPVRSLAVFSGGALLGLAVGLVAGRMVAPSGGRPEPVVDLLAARDAGDGGPSSAGAEQAAGSFPQDERTRRAIEGVRGGSRTRGVAALATLSALRGDEDAFLSHAAEALARGASLDDLLVAVREFPPERQGAILSALLDRAAGTPISAAAARLLAESGYPERALALVRAALPLQSRFQPGLAQLLLQLDPEGGLDFLFRIEGADAWGASDLGVLHAALAGSEALPKLVPFVERALADRPSDHGLLRLLRRLDLGSARARAEDLLARSPNDPWVLAFLGEVRRDAGDLAGAFEAFQAAASRAPSRSTFRELVRLDPARGLEVVLGLTRDTADDEMLGAQAEMYLTAGRKDDAVKAYLRAHEHDPADGEWIARLTEIDPSAAIAALERQIGPVAASASAKTLGRYARALEAAGRAQDAFGQYMAAFEKDPTNDEWQRSLARLDPQAALPTLEAHAREYPRDASGHGALATALSAAGRRGEAVAHFERALETGDYERWYPALRDLDPDRALEGLRLRANAEDRDAAAWALLGAELRERNLRTEAKAAYERAAAIDPSDDEVARALRDLR